MNFTLSPFHPQRRYANRHLQTIVGSRMHATDGIMFRRQRLELPDGDFLDVDFADITGHTWADMGDDAPIALILHGLEGSARRPYACAMYRDLAAQGIRSIGLNFRSCSGEINRLPRAYHAGETQDVHFVHQWLAKTFPHVPKMMVGFSLGANILLKYLGDGLYPLASTLKAAVAVSPPFDLAKNSDYIGRFYTHYMVRTLRRKLEQKAALLDNHLSMERLRLVKSIYDFDKLYTASLHGFSNADVYYAQTSCGQFLATIRIPTLILRALDDPLFHPHDIPLKVIEANPQLVGGITAKGGHVGFMERWGVAWAQREAANFIKNMNLF